jgi:hypothetical protein
MCKYFQTFFQDFRQSRIIEDFQPAQIAITLWGERMFHQTSSTAVIFAEHADGEEFACERAQTPNTAAQRQK